jgi:hypothetical protein
MINVKMNYLEEAFLVSGPARTLCAKLPLFLVLVGVSLCKSVKVEYISMTLTVFEYVALPI